LLYAVLCCGVLCSMQRLSCRVLRAEEVHPQLFKGANRKFKKVSGWQPGVHHTAIRLNHQWCTAVVVQHKRY